MPKSRKQQDGAANMLAKPYPIFQDGDEQPRRKHKKSNGQTATANDSKFDPLSSQSMLLGVIKHHKATLDAIRKEKAEIVDKMHKTTFSNTDKTQKLLKVQKQLHDFEQQVEKLTNERSQQLQQINNLELKCIDAKTKYTALETGYDQKVVNFNLVLSKTKTELLAQEKENKDLHKQLQIVQQNHQEIAAQLQGVIQEKDNQLAHLEMQYMQLQAHFSEVTASYEQDKLELEQKLATASQVAETGQAELKVELQQQKAEFACQSESLTLLETELQSTIKKLFETEKHCDELQQLNQDISTKASNTAQCLQIEIEQQKLIINELSSNNRDVRAAYVTEKMALDDKIEALKQANEQLKAAAEAKAFEDQQKLNKRDEQIAELKKLEQQNLHLTKLSSAENSELAKQLLSLQEVHEVSRTSFRDKLQQKDDNIAACNEKYAEMERQKNITIAELKFKINQISKAFDQPIGSGRGTKQQENNMKPTTTIELQKNTETLTPLQPVAAATSSQALDESICKIAAEVEASTSDVGRRRKQLKRPIYQYNSDFNTDDDQMSDWTPSLPKTIARNRVANKTRNNNVKRVRHLSPYDIDEDLFDKVKRL